MSAISNQPDEDADDAADTTRELYDEHRDTIHELAEDEDVSRTIQALAQAAIDVAGGEEDDE